TRARRGVGRPRRRAPARHVRPRRRVRARGQSRARGAAGHPPRRNGVARRHPHEHDPGDGLRFAVARALAALSRPRDPPRRRGVRGALGRGEHPRRVGDVPARRRQRRAGGHRGRRGAGDGRSPDRLTTRPYRSGTDLEAPAEALRLGGLGLRLAPVEDGEVVAAGGQPAHLLALAGLEPDRARRVVDHELVLGQPLPVEDEDAGQPRLEAHLDVGLRCGDAPGRRPDLPDVGVQRLATLIGCVGVEAQERKQADDEREPADDDHHAPRMDLLARPCASDARPARHARLLCRRRTQGNRRECREFEACLRYRWPAMALTGLADLAGRVLADRYRLLAPIGTGGSGHVYVADDVHLRRRVAVKVLHGALADDAGFLRRFRAEAQLAASLHHPNITTVYDWGEDAVPFMVLELLSGGSLRGMLDDGIRLSPAQAAYVGRQVAAALSYAHSRGLVHRDIKPANLLFDEHGTVRGADFGLARALAEASWTEPTGALVGTARYAAPEQATGATLDGRADLYALGIVLVESVTGHIPDLADTLIGTLAVRARTPLVAPAELGALAPVVERAGRPRPSERYPDATTMADALTDASRHLPPPGPLTLVGLDAHVDPHPTELGARHGQAVFDQDADTVA